MFTFADGSSVEHLISVKTDSQKEEMQDLLWLWMTLLIIIVVRSG